MYRYASESSTRYDAQATTFSPEGRIYQVEYAEQCTQNGLSAFIGVVATDGIVIVSNRYLRSKLLEPDMSSKFHIISDNVICTFSGLLPDGLTLMEHSRQAAQRYLISSNTSIPCRQLVHTVANLKQAYTQHAGLRPFGVSIMYAGWDPENHYQLFTSTPAGSFEAWKATSLGQGSRRSLKLLEERYREGRTLEESCVMALQVLLKSLDATQDFNACTVDIATLERTGDGKTVHHLWNDTEINSFCEKHVL